ncbi:MAG: GNAT family N-acetyltransferase [Flavobacteriaceae bacterium]|nr:MAG: GNAT family N-acetyltransferase [Flavobacteriaceae bacterium]
MTPEAYIIREIKLEDNRQIAAVIRQVLIEMGVPKVGTAYEDTSLDDMFEAYTIDRAAYFVIVHNDTIIGGCGIAQLDDFGSNTCELQKMYFLPEARGKGLGAKMIAICLTKAKDFGFEQCYLETMPYMKAAQKLYKKNGFAFIDGPMGNTGHYSCNVWMIKQL